MSMMQHGPGDITRLLNHFLDEAGQAELQADVASRFEAYLHLLIRWNSRTNLTAIRDVDGILRRHFVESIAAARALPSGNGTLLDYGSGAGFPGVPIALCRPDLSVTLAESQNKKAAFLHEAVRTLGIDVQIHGSRAENLDRLFDCVTLRAVDRMEEAVRSACDLVRPGGWLAPLTTRAESAEIFSLAGAGFEWDPPITLPGGDSRILLAGRKAQ